MCNIVCYTKYRVYMFVACNFKLYIKRYNAVDMYRYRVLLYGDRACIINLL